MRIDIATAETLRPWFPDLDMSSVRIVTRGPGPWVVRHVLKQGAMTFAPFIFFGRDPYDPTTARGLALIAHELKHVEQFLRYGRVSFVARYLWHKARNGFRYSRDLPFEVEPYALQAEVRRALSDRFP